MKKGLFFALAIALGLTSCNNEDNFAMNEETTTAYMQITVALPAADGTRSSTNDDGTSSETENTEDGQAYENNITSLKVALVDPTNNVIEVSASNGGTTSGSTYTTNPFPISSLAASTVYKVYVVANAGSTYSVSDGVDAHCTLENANLTASIAKPNAFLMTNAEVATTVTTGSDLTIYTQTAPLNCGSVKLERASARFDYKQGVTNDEHTVSGVTITIKEAALMNVSKTFYYFKRVSATGTDATWSIGGNETSTNYVVDHNFAAKTKTAVESASWTGADYFFNNMVPATATAPYGTTYTELSSLLTADNWGSKSYKIWTYATENTIQGIDNQVNGLTTAVVFKAEITGTPFNGTDAIYVFNNLVIGNWAAVWGSSNIDVQNAIAASGKLVDVEATNAVQDLADAGFTRYTPASGKYYAYYIYWNRHNDNGNPSSMGPMEFAVVRNNVYKLAVTKIAGFGHPNDPINPDPTIPVNPDPNKPDPENPDEDSNMYMTVSVEILPWTVRVNDIEFN